MMTSDGLPVLQLTPDDLKELFDRIQSSLKNIQKYEAIFDSISCPDCLIGLNERNVLEGNREDKAKNISPPYRSE
jgi:hypothetical protein